MNNNYKCLSKQVFSNEEYSIVPIRIEDRYNIMKWRNEQVYHLRQDKQLTKENQDKYFNEVVSALFELEQPNQILFSYLEGDKCIGYGGLVHINWEDKNAEISFIMDTDLEKDCFELHWRTFLNLIEKVAFQDLGIHKIYTYAFDLRPFIYKIFEDAEFCQEVILRDHIRINKKDVNIVIHSKINDYE